MTRTEQLDLIRQKAIEANPDILDLKFGCEIERPDHARHYRVIEDIGWGNNQKRVWVNSVPFGAMDMPFERAKNALLNGDEEWKIIGRPIRLADVLLALNNHKSVREPDKHEWQIYGLCNDAFPRSWNLRKDDLSEQSDECISFLYELLQ